MSRSPKRRKLTAFDDEGECALLKTIPYRVITRHILPYHLLDIKYHHKEYRLIAILDREEDRPWTAGVTTRCAVKLFDAFGRFRRDVTRKVFVVFRSIKFSPPSPGRMRDPLRTRGGGIYRPEWTDVRFVLPLMMDYFCLYGGGVLQKCLCRHLYLGPRVDRLPYALTHGESSLEMLTFDGFRSRKLGRTLHTLTFSRLIDVKILRTHTWRHSDFSLNLHAPRLERVSVMCRLNFPVVITGNPNLEQLEWHGERDDFPAHCKRFRRTLKHIRMGDHCKTDFLPCLHIGHIPPPSHHRGQFPGITITTWRLPFKVEALTVLDMNIPRFVWTDFVAPNLRKLRYTRVLCRDFQTKEFVEDDGFLPWLDVHGDQLNTLCITEYTSRIDDVIVRVPNVRQLLCQLKVHPVGLDFLCVDPWHLPHVKDMEISFIWTLLRGELVKPKTKKLQRTVTGIDAPKLECLSMAYISVDVNFLKACAQRGVRMFLNEVSIFNDDPTDPFKWTNVQGIAHLHF